MFKCDSRSPHLRLRALHHLWQSRWSLWRWSRETRGHLPGGRGCLRAARESSWISWTRLCNIELWVNTHRQTQLQREDIGVFAWWKDAYCLYSSHLRHPEEAPWKAGQLLSKFLFKWTQISAWRQSGKPYNTNSNKKTKHRYACYLEQPAVFNHLPLGPCSYQCRLYKTRHVESIPLIFVSVDSESGRICWTLSLSAWLSDTWRHIQWSNECEENIMYLI